MQPTPDRTPVSRDPSDPLDPTGHAPPPSAPIAAGEGGGDPPCARSLGADPLEAPRAQGPTRRERLASLVALLEDDSATVLETVRRELEEHPAAEGVLRKATNDARPRIRGRARRILAERHRREVMRRLFGYAAREEMDLEQALFLLARLEDPALDRRPYVRALDAMGQEVAKRAAREPDAFARPMVLPQYLGNELGYVGSETDFNHPDHIHLHRAIERKRGMPLTLTAIYLAVARRAGIEASPLALPGRVLLSLEAGRRAIVVDPFGGGRTRSRIDCVQYLAQHGLVPRPDWFRAADDRTLVQRQVLNLMASCQMRGLAREARHLHRLAMAIGRAGA